MHKTLKVSLSVFAAIVLFVVIIAALLPLFISPNDFKPQIASAVKDKIGRDLTIEGDIELSIFPWIGVTVEKLALSNAGGFQEIPFAKIGTVHIKAKLIPLFAKKLEVDRILLKDVVLNLEKNEAGAGNWEDFTQKEPDVATSATTVWEDTDTGKADSEAAKIAAALAVAGITLENAQLNWHDRQKNNRLSINALYFDSGELAFDRPIDFNLRFVMDHPDLEITGQYQLIAAVSFNESFDRFNATRFDLTTQIQGKAIPSGSLAATMTLLADLDLKAQTLQLAQLNAESGPLHATATLSGTTIIDAPVFQGPVSIARFNPSAWLKQAGIEQPAMRDEHALTSLSADLSLRISTETAEFQNITIALDESMIKGMGRVDNFSDPVIQFNLNIDTLNVDRYLAPKEEADNTSRPIAGPAAAAAAGASMIPIETLRNLKIDGLLSIERLTVGNMSLRGVDFKLNANEGKVDTRQSVKSLYRGAYQGTMNLDVTGALPQWRLNEKFSGIHVEPLMNDFAGHSKIAGILTASTNLRASGNHTKALKSSLNGEVDFLFKDSIIRGFNLQQIIDDAKSLLKGAPVIRDNPKDQTAFSEIKGHARIVNGVISNNDLTAKASKLQATGNGTVDLNTERIDYRVNAKLVGSKTTETKTDKLKEIPVVINITGNFNEPEYKLDIASMLKDQPLEKLERKKNKLLDKLDKKIGPGASDLLKKLLH